MMQKIYKKICTQLCSMSRLDVAVYVALVGMGLWWFTVTYLQYYGFGFRGGDSSVAEQALWNTIFMGDLFQQSFLHIPGESNFREHLNFIQFLYLPFYAIIPHTLTLFAIIQTIFIGAAIALYRFAITKVSRITATIATAIFVLHPLTVLQTVDQMHVVALTGPFFLFALIAYEKHNLRTYILWIFLTAIISEFVAPTVFLMGVIALIDRRSWQWIMAPMVFGTAMYAVAKYYITIGFGAHDQIIKNISQAITTVDGLDKRIDVFVDMLKPLAVIIPFFSRYALLLAPSIMIVMMIALAGRLKTGAHVLIFVPPILAIIFIDLARKWHGTWKVRVLQGVVVIALFASLDAWTSVMHVRTSSLAPALKNAVVAVKDGGSVTADPAIGIYLCRREVFDLVANHSMTDYIIIKRSKYSIDKKRDFSKPPRYNEQILDSGLYREVFRDGRVVVFAKKTKVHEILGISLEEIETLSDDVIQELWARIPVQKHYDRQIF